MEPFEAPRIKPVIAPPPRKLISASSNDAKPSFLRSAPKRHFRHLPEPLENPLPVGPVVIPEVEKVSGPAYHKETRHVLVCAPSNAAVDELVRRLLHSDSLIGSEGQRFRTRKLVRLGNEKNLPPEINSVSLTTLVGNVLEVKKGEAAVELKRNQLKLKGAPALMSQRAKHLHLLVQEQQALKHRATLSILNNATIICSTLSGCGSGLLEQMDHGFDICIVDEAAQCVEPSSLLAFRQRCAHIVLVGDTQQLPPTVISPAATKAGYNRSLFERLETMGMAKERLVVQYRMHPLIREFPSSHFYDGQLQDGPNVMVSDRLGHPIYQIPCIEPFLFINVESSQETLSAQRSLSNSKECKLVIELCTWLETFAVQNKKFTMGILTPYKAQVSHLKTLVEKKFEGKFPLEINTVDGYQGRELDLLLFSCVRASDRGNIGFLHDVRRMNVALTRAKYACVVFGHAKTLMRASAPWKALITHAQNRKAYLDVPMGSTLQEAIEKLSPKAQELLASGRKTEHFKYCADFPFPSKKRLGDILPKKKKKIVDVQKAPFAVDLSNEKGVRAVRASSSSKLFNGNGSQASSSRAAPTRGTLKGASHSSGSRSTLRGKGVQRSTTESWKAPLTKSNSATKGHSVWTFTGTVPVSRNTSADSNQKGINERNRRKKDMANFIAETMDSSPTTDHSDRNGFNRGFDKRNTIQDQKKNIATIAAKTISARYGGKRGTNGSSQPRGKTGTNTSVQNGEKKQIVVPNSRPNFGLFKSPLTRLQKNDVNDSRTNNADGRYVRKTTTTLNESASRSSKEIPGKNERRASYSYNTTTPKRVIPEQKRVPEKGRLVIRNEKRVPEKGRLVLASQKHRVPEKGRVVVRNEKRPSPNSWKNDRSDKRPKDSRNGVVRERSLLDSVLRSSSRLPEKPKR